MTKNVLMLVSLAALLALSAHFWTTVQDEIFVDVSTLEGLMASNCGGNCPSGRCDSCPCGTTRNVLPQSQIDSICASYSWNQACCKCIISKESGGNANAVNQNTGVSANLKYDVGLFQVNQQNWNACNGGKAPCSVSSNTACAKMVYGWGGWKLWSTGKSCGCA